MASEEMIFEYFFLNHAFGRHGKKSNLEVVGQKTTCGGGLLKEHL